jgi:phage gp29-like protein
MINAAINKQKNRKGCEQQHFGWVRHSSQGFGVNLPWLKNRVKPVVDDLNAVCVKLKTEQSLN